MSADDFEQAIGVIHTIAKEELGRPLTLNLHIRRDHSRGAATDNKTRLAIVPALELLERRVKALDRPVSEVLRHTPRRTTLAPVAIEMLKQFLKSVSDWNEEGQQQQHDQAAEQESEKKPAKKKAKPKANTQPAETETVGG
jgi:hypothetical protein